MVKSSITALCASKNVLCAHKDGNTIRYVVWCHWMHHRHHNTGQKFRKSDENPPLPRKQIIGVERRKDSAESHTWGEHCSSLSQQVSKHTGMEDLISSAVAAEQQATGRPTPSYETWLSEWLCHTGKPSPVIIPVSLDPSPGLQQPRSTSGSSTGTC